MVRLVVFGVLPAESLFQEMPRIAASPCHPFLESSKVWLTDKISLINLP